MWLTSSSVGRKFVMALTGAALVLFVTFHCLMNSVAIFWPTAYNAVCEFLGANWYALVASAGLALLIVIHIIYAIWLTLQNRAARGNVRYAIETRPASVEWASKNMLVLGIVVLAFLGVHLIQFWAKMQLVEVLGCEGEFPAAAGTLFLQEAFSCWITPVVYLIGFIALWFHLNHGFWSMFQSVGWDNTAWIPRLKCIGKWWIGIVMVLFVAQLAVFTYRANDNYYLENEALRAQYQEMIVNSIASKADSQTAAYIENQIGTLPYDQAASQIRMMAVQAEELLNAFTPEVRNSIKGIESLENVYDSNKGILEPLKTAVSTLDAIKAPTAEEKKSLEEARAQLKSQIPYQIQAEIQTAKMQPQQVQQTPQ